MNAVRLALDNLDDYGEYTKVHFDGASFSNAHMVAFARSLATVLRDHGVKSGEHVAVMMPNTPEVEGAFQASWMLGAVITPITSQLGVPEVSYMLADAGITAILTSPKLAERVVEAAAHAPSVRQIFTFGDSDVPGTINLLRLVLQAPQHQDIVARDEDDLALLLYTSGTTGHPKGVMLSHANLILGTEAIVRRNPGIARQILLHPLPLSHVYGVLIMNLCNRWGWTQVLMPHFETKKAFELIQRYKANRISVTPTMLVYMINFPERTNYDTSSLNVVSSGGAALLESVRTEFQALFNCKVMQGYGLSETAAVATGYEASETYRPGSAGRALPGIELAILDGSGLAKPAGEAGEIAVRGANVMKGYWKKSEATATAMADGWLLTGDIGHLDNDGYLFITDRKKDLIIKGGENISPKEIEEALHSHFAVAEVAVFSYPDHTFGENVGAAVVLRSGMSATDEELRAHCAQFVTKFKLPATFLYMDALPKSPNGKILKREIKIPAKMVS
jgi:long-chain acyl-CoA synthetase